MKQTFWNPANDAKKWTPNFLASRDDRSTLLVQPERPPIAPVLAALPEPPVPAVRPSPIADPLCWKTTLDPKTGATLYWNEQANVTTWEVPQCLKATMEWKQQQAREKGFNELAAARRQLLGRAAEEEQMDSHDRYFLDAPPGLSPNPPPTTPSVAVTQEAKVTPPASTPKLSPDEEKKQKEKAAFAKWQERQQATKKPRLMTSSIKRAQTAGALQAVEKAVKEKDIAGGTSAASGPALPGGKAAPVVEVKKPVPKAEVLPVSAGETCNACLAFGYKMVDVVTEVLGQTITHHYCWDCVPGSAAAERKARKPKRTARIKGEGVMQHHPANDDEDDR